MSGVTHIWGWPSALDCIDWSADGILAIAAGDRVELLVPNLEPIKEADTDLGPSPSPWLTVPLHTSLFHEQDLPVKTEPGQAFSVGEEISSSNAAKLAWSPPGLAKHKGCALAVLTTNLVLSIWAPNTDPKKAASWERVLIVNEALRRHFKDRSTPQPTEDSEAQDVKRRLGQRIRAFSWSPSSVVSRCERTVGMQISCGSFAIAVSNDNNEIAIVSIRSPFEALSSRNTWTAEVLDHFQPTNTNGDQQPVPGTFDELIREQRYIGYIAWGPWIHYKGSSVVDEGFHHPLNIAEKPIRDVFQLTAAKGEKTLPECTESLIAYSTNDRIYTRKVTQCVEVPDKTASKPRIAIDNEHFSDKASHIQEAGLLKWCPTTDSQDRMLLMVFSLDKATCYIVDTANMAISEQKKHHMDGRWDTISGAAFDPRLPDNIRLHFASFQSSARGQTSCLGLKGEDLIALQAPSWHTQVQESVAYYSANYDLAGNATARVWGLASSPMHDYIATCFTLHPTDMLEYAQPVDLKTTITTNRMGNFGEESILSLGPNPPSTTAEALIFTLKRWFENNTDTKEEIDEGKIEILRALLAFFGPIPARITIPNHSPPTNSPMTNAMIAPVIDAFKQNVYLSQTTLKHRYDILISTVCAPHVNLELQRLSIIIHLANETRLLPSWLSTHNSFSKKILANLSLLLRKLSQVSQSTNGTDPDPVLETCDICKTNITFESLEWARCEKGHQFSRCGLTFLAIQAPLISKFCGICKRQFLNEERIDENGNIRPHRDNGVRADRDTEMQDANGEDHDSSVSSVTTLAQLLFTACEVCIYCGGKYVG